jgi:putative ABC transport system permease protein
VGDRTDRTEEIIVQARPGRVETAARAIDALLARRFRVVPGARAPYEIVVPRELLRARLRSQRTFNAVLLSIGGLALLVSGIGIMNVMLASVAERTEEIGVRRALGARRRDILQQFALEAGVLCATASVAGIALGALLSAAIAAAAGWRMAMGVSGIALSLLLSAVLAFGVGLYPARRASRLDPATVLRM